MPTRVHTSKTRGRTKRAPTNLQARMRALCSAHVHTGNRWVARVCRVRRPRRPAKMRAHTAAQRSPSSPSVAANSAVGVPGYQPHRPQRADQTATQKPPRGHNLNRPSGPLRSNPYAATRTTRRGPHGQQRETAAALLATRATKGGPNGYSKTTARPRAPTLPASHPGHRSRIEEKPRGRRWPGTETPARRTNALEMRAYAPRERLHAARTPAAQPAPSPTHQC